MKYVKINQVVKICVYGENLTAKVINATSSVDADTDANEENGTTTTTEPTEEVKLAEELDGKLNLDEKEAQKPALVSC